MVLQIHLDSSVSDSSTACICLTIDGAVVLMRLSFDLLVQRSREAKRELCFGDVLHERPVAGHGPCIMAFIVCDVLTIVWTPSFGTTWPRSSPSLAVSHVKGSKFNILGHGVVRYSFDC